MKLEKFYQPTDLATNDAKALEAEAAAKAAAEEAERPSDKNEILMRQAEGGSSFREKRTKMVAETGARMNSAKEIAGEFIGKAAEKGGNLFSFLKSKWNDGIQAVERGATRLAQGWTNSVDAINNRIDSSVSMITAISNKVAELSSNWARETAEDCRKDIEAGVQNTADFFVEIYDAGKQGAENAVRKSKNKYWGLKLAILKEISGAGSALAQKAEKQISITSNLRDIASISAPEKPSEAPSEMRDEGIEAAFTRAPEGPVELDQAA